MGNKQKARVENVEADWRENHKHWDKIDVRVLKPVLANSPAHVYCFAYLIGERNAKVVSVRSCHAVVGPRGGLKWETLN